MTKVVYKHESTGRTDDDNNETKQNNNRNRADFVQYTHTHTHTTFWMQQMCSGFVFISSSIVYIHFVLISINVMLINLQAKRSLSLVYFSVFACADCDFSKQSLYYWRRFCAGDWEPKHRIRSSRRLVRTSSILHLKRYACQLYWSRGTGTYYIQLHLLHWYSAQTHRVHVIYRFIIGHHILFTQFIVLYRLVYMAFIQSAATLAAISNMNVWLYDMIVYTLTKMPFTLSVLETA